jgi:uncharacterized protein (DUF1330 family)
LDWDNSPEYQKAAVTRDAASTSHVFLLEAE